MPRFLSDLHHLHGVLRSIERDLDLFNLAQATKITGVSDTTLMKLIKAKLLPAAQVAP